MSLTQIRPGLSARALARSTASRTIYVDPAGSDLAPGTESAPVKTFAEALSRLPGRLDHNVNIVAAAGTYNEALTVRQLGLGRLSILGAYTTLVDDLTITAVDGVNLSVAAAFATDEYRGRVCEVYLPATGAMVAQFTIRRNTATQLRTGGTLPTITPGTQKARILGYGTVIDGGNSAFHQFSGGGAVAVARGVKLTGLGTSVSSGTQLSTSGACFATSVVGGFPAFTSRGSGMFIGLGTIFDADGVTPLVDGAKTALTCVYFDGGDATRGFVWLDPGTRYSGVTVARRVSFIANRRSTLTLSRIDATESAVTADPMSTVQVSTAPGGGRMNGPSPNGEVYGFSCNGAHFRPVVADDAPLTVEGHSAASLRLVENSWGYALNVVGDIPGARGIILGAGSALELDDLTAFTNAFEEANLDNVAYTLAALRGAGAPNYVIERTVSSAYSG